SKFKSKKDLAHTISIRSQNFSRRDWNHFYVSYLHNQSMCMRTPRKKLCIITQNKRDLQPLHFEPQRKHNKWPFKKINCDCKVTYRRKTNDWILSWVHERPKRNREAHEKFVAIDPGVQTLFVMCSPTEGVTEIGKNDAQRFD